MVLIRGADMIFILCAKVNNIGHGIFAFFSVKYFAVRKKHPFFASAFKSSLHGPFV